MKDLFTELADCKTKVTLGDDTDIEVTQKGSVTINTITFTALYIPSFTLNLISVSQLDKLGYAAIFGSKSVLIYNTLMQPAIAGQLAGGLYWVSGNKTDETAIAMATTRSTMKDALQQLDMTAPEHRRKREHRQNRRARKRLSKATPTNADPPPRSVQTAVADASIPPVVEKPPDTPPSNVKISDTPFEGWHRRFAHVGAEAVRRILAQNNIAPKPSGKPAKCETCIKGKHKSRPQRKTKPTRSTKPFELVHSDVAGPFNVESHSRKLYFIIFVDDYSKYTFIYYLRSPGAEEIVEKFEDFCNWVEARGWKILRLRSDSSVAHFVNNEFKTARKERGIEGEQSPPYCQHKNGAAERMIQTIVLKARCVCAPSLPELVNMHFRTLFIDRFLSSPHPGHTYPERAYRTFSRERTLNGPTICTRTGPTTFFFPNKYPEWAYHMFFPSHLPKNVP